MVCTARALAKSAILATDGLPSTTGSSSISMAADGALAGRIKFFFCSGLSTAAAAGRSSQKSPEPAGSCLPTKGTSAGSAAGSAVDETAAAAGSASTERRNINGMGWSASAVGRTATVGSTAVTEAAGAATMTVAGAAAWPSAGISSTGNGWSPGSSRLVASLPAREASGPSGAKSANEYWERSEIVCRLSAMVRGSTSSTAGALEGDSAERTGRRPPKKRQYNRTSSAIRLRNKKTNKAITPGIPSKARPGRVSSQ